MLTIKACKILNHHFTTAIHFLINIVEKGKINKDLALVARELIEHGWEFLMIKLYRDGKLSLSTLATRLELSVSETLDLLAEFGIESPIGYDDYLKGFEVFK